MLTHRPPFLDTGQRRLDFGIVVLNEDDIQPGALDVAQNTPEEGLAGRVGQHHPPTPVIAVARRLQRQNRVVGAGQATLQQALGDAGAQQALTLHRRNDGAAQLLAVQTPLDQEVLRAHAHRLGGKAFVIIAGQHQNRAVGCHRQYR